MPKKKKEKRRWRHKSTDVLTSQLSSNVAVMPPSRLPTTTTTSCLTENADIQRLTVTTKSSVYYLLQNFIFSCPFFSLSISHHFQWKTKYRGVWTYNINAPFRCCSCCELLQLLYREEKVKGKIIDNILMSYLCTQVIDSRIHQSIKICYKW